MNIFRSAIFVLTIAILPAGSYAQTAEKFAKDSILVVENSPQKGFHNAYILFIPKGAAKNKTTYLLVETNNTGDISDDIDVHKKAAMSLAAKSSVGNNISTELRIPLLVPIFPRPASKPLTYSHALDRDVMLEEAPGLKRLDLQLIAMVKDARKKLEAMQIPTREQIFLNGFSASGSFANRFVAMHPGFVRAAAMGGFNGELILPFESFQGKSFNYPLGTNDLKSLAGIRFDEAAFKTVPQFIYMGALDDNDAVQYDDAYSESERDLINSNLGSNVQTRWQNVQNIYAGQNVNARFKTYPDVGHWTTPSVNLDVILFFNDFLKQQ